MRATALAADWYDIDFRQHPEQYRVGRGEMGVLTAEPYKSELLPHWRFRTPDIARHSAMKLYLCYLRYQRERDAVGMDMSRKYLMMGWTRSMRYGNRRTGKKYDGPVPSDKRGISGSHGRVLLPLDPDPVKVQCAAIFYRYYRRIVDDPVYQAAKAGLRK